MTKRKGSCLCGARTYEIAGDIDGVWMCHCSKCRKAAGSKAMSIIIVPKDRFRWLTGKDLGERFELTPTYSITRCKACGSPLPVEEDEKNVYLAAGSLDDPLGAGIKTHIFCGSKADWDVEADGVQSFDEFPV